MTLGEWFDEAWEILGGSRPHRVAVKANHHALWFPLDEVSSECDVELLQQVQELLTHTRPFARPTRGHRADHWTTPALMAVNNQLQRLNHERRNS